ncbi:MAG: hypothetical protein KBD23_05525 [Gammaproteobacteria bacterium]|nr:hypothetical protein [Gammaproteobacteria bacterium]
MSNSPIPPKVIRLKDAPRYLGMDKNRFNQEVRPYVIEFPIGVQGVGFERIDLDAWLDSYKKCHGRPAVNQELSAPKSRRNDIKVAASGTFRAKSLDKALDSVLDLILCKKQKAYSQKIE